MNNSKRGARMHWAVRDEVEGLVVAVNETKDEMGGHLIYFLSLPQGDSGAQIP